MENDSNKSDLHKNININKHETKPKTFSTYVREKVDGHIVLTMIVNVGKTALIE